MFAVVVTFMIKPGQMEAFLPLMIENAKTSKEIEPGCQQFDICTKGEDHQVFLFEIYDDAAAFEIHLQSDHFKVFDKQVSDMVASKSVQLFHEVIR